MPNLLIFLNLKLHLRRVRLQKTHPSTWFSISTVVYAKMESALPQTYTFEVPTAGSCFTIQEYNAKNVIHFHVQDNRKMNGEESNTNIYFWSWKEPYTIKSSENVTIRGWGRGIGQCAQNSRMHDRKLTTPKVSCPSNSVPSAPGCAKSQSPASLLEVRKLNITLLK